MAGFVSGELLKIWCGKNEGLDREACYSYLRGASDAFHAVADAEAKDATTPHSPTWPNQCMPPRVSITTIQDVFLEFAAHHPERMSNQAAALLAEALPQAFPCPMPEKEPQ